MRIAHISDCFLPRLGGIETQVAELTRHQAAAGDEVAVVTATPGGSRQDSVDNVQEFHEGVAVHRTVANLPFELPVHPRTAHVVTPVLREFEPDVVHVHLGAVSPYAWGGLRAAIRVGAPIVATVHSVWGRQSQLGYAGLDKALSLTKYGLVYGAVSQMVAERIRAALGSSARIALTPNGVDEQVWSPAGRAVRTDGPVQFVAGMRLAPRKRAQPLVEMFVQALAEVGDPTAAHLSIAGDGPQRSRLESLIDQLGLTDSVTLLGRLDRPSLHQRYLDSDVYVQPSVMESFGLAALEARTTGLPVIARSQTGLADFIRNEQEGLLAADDDQMAAAMARLITDRDLRQQITEHNSDHLPEQTWDGVLAAVRQAYTQAST